MSKNQHKTDTTKLPVAYLVDTGIDPCAYSDEFFDKAMFWIESHCKGKNAVIWKRTVGVSKTKDNDTINHYEVIMIWKGDYWIADLRKRTREVTMSNERGWDL